MEHIEAEGSDDFGSEALFSDGKGVSPVKNTQSRVGKENESKVDIQRGCTMYVNGRPIRIDRGNMALNKREKSNWLVHILFIR
jgi:hypothetical protein